MSAQATVFVLDDDDAVRDSMRALFDTVGLAVRTFGSGVEFLEELQPDWVGCVVLDVRMPGLSGLEIQEKLAENNAALPVVIITGHGDLPMAVRAMKAGAVDFIEKPFDDNVIIDNVRGAGQRRKGARRGRGRRPLVGQPGAAHWARTPGARAGRHGPPQQGDWLQFGYQSAYRGDSPGAGD